MQEEVRRDGEIIDFVDFWFKFKPHKYQKEFLMSCCKDKRICGLWSRQSGKSTCISMYVLYMCLVNSLFKVMVIAPTQDQSSEMYKKIRTTAEENDLIRPYIKSCSQTEIELMNGSRIRALPCGPEGVTIRGYTADIVIEEEAGYIKDDINSKVITPMIGSKQSYGQMIKIGTPFGKNHFWESCYGKQTKYKLFHYDYKIVLEAGQYSEEFIDEQKKNLTELEFGTEYEAKFIEDSDSYFKQSLIDSCVEDYEMGVTHKKSLFVLGVDFARLGQDSSVFIVVEENMRKEIRVNFIEETKHKLTTDAIGRIKLLNEKYDFIKIYLDETGLGAGPTDILVEHFGEKVEGMTFTIKSKMDLYSNLKKLMEQGKLKIPSNRKLLYQLADLRYDVSSSGNLKIHHSERGHDDYTDALALSVYFWKEQEIEIYEPWII